MGSFQDAVNAELRRRKGLGNCKTCGYTMYPSSEPVKNEGGKATAPKPVCENPKCGSNSTANKMSLAIKLIRERAAKDPSVVIHHINEDCSAGLCEPGVGIKGKPGNTVVHIDQRTAEERDPSSRKHIPKPLNSTHVFFDR